MLSVIIPSFNEEQMIPITSNTIAGILSQNKIEYELIFVDDGSKDRTWNEIERTSKAQIYVRGIKFSRNFGKEAAIMAGLSVAEGQCCVVIDCDLQHPPEKIVEMYRLWEEGYEIIEGVKNSRGNEGRLHKFATQRFYSLISRATGFDMSRTSDFKLLDRKAVDIMLSMREKNGFFRAMSAWVGYKAVTISFDVQERTAGETKWSTGALISYAIKNITSFSTAPMQLVTVLGIIMLMFSVVFGCISIIQKMIGVALDGFTTVIILQAFSSSIIMMSVGILGYYIARIFEEVKNRPNYVISDICGSTVNKLNE